MSLLRKSRLVALVLLLAGVTAGCSPKAGGPAASGGSDTLRFGFPGAAPLGTVGWAMERGLLQPALAKIGINHIVMISGGSGPLLNEIFASHGVDLYITGDTPAIIGRAAGLRLRLINLDLSNYPLQLIVRGDGPQRVEDLVGKKIPVYQGTNQMHYVYGLLAAKGILDKVQIVNMNLSGDAVAAALLRGDIDAAAVSNGAMYVSRGFRIIDSSWDHPGLSGNSPIVGSEAFLAAHPDFVRVFNEVRVQTIADLDVHPGPYYDYLAKHYPYTRQLLPSIYPLSCLNPDPFPAGSLDALDGLKKFLIDQHIVRDDFSIAGWIAPQAAPGTGGLTTSTPPISNP